MVNVDANLIIKVLCCIFLPPLGVFLHSGISTDFWVDLILTFFLFFPGSIYAAYVVFFKSKASAPAVATV